MYSGPCLNIGVVFPRYANAHVKEKMVLYLTHWGRATHICISKLTIIGSDNGLSPEWRQAIIWTNAGILLIDHSRYYYSHLVAVRGRGRRKPRVRVVWTNMTMECEVKCKYHWDIVQNKYENLMMLHIWILCGEDLFSMGIYRLIQTKIYFTVCISMYVKSSVPACMWLILQRPLMATRWL